MASPGGAKKGKTQHLTEFLRPEASLKSTKSGTSWADELDATENGENSTLPEVKFEDVPEDEPAEFGRSPPGHGAHSAGILPPHVRLPTQPPYKAYLKNLPFNVTEEDLVSFFRDLTVQDVHMLTHQDTGKLRGCFVAFATPEEVGLAVARDGSTLMGRPIHIEVAEAKPDRRGGGFGGRERGGSFDEDRDRPRYGFSGGRYDDDPAGGAQWGRGSGAPSAAPVERTISGERAPLSLPATSSGPKSNPFGSAKPIDTASKLQELEARIAERKAKEAAEAAAAAAAARAQAEAAGPGPPDDSAPLSPTRRGPPPDSPSAAAQQHRQQPMSPGHARGPAGGGRGRGGGRGGGGPGAGPGRGPAAPRAAAPNGVAPDTASAPAGPPKGWAKPEQGPIDVVDLSVGADISLGTDPAPPPAPQAAAAPAAPTEPAALDAVPAPQAAEPAEAPVSAAGAGEPASVPAERGGRSGRRGRGEGRGGYQGRGGYEGRGDRGGYQGRGGPPGYQGRGGRGEGGGYQGRGGSADGGRGRHSGELSGRGVEGGRGGVADAGRGAPTGYQGRGRGEGGRGRYDDRGRGRGPRGGRHEDRGRGRGRGGGPGRGDSEPPGLGGVTVPPGLPQQHSQQQQSQQQQPAAAAKAAPVVLATEPAKKPQKAGNMFDLLSSADD